MSGIKKSKEFVSEPMKVKGYTILDTLKSGNGGNCKWGFARKSGKEYFIKEFIDPKFPDENAEISKTFLENAKRECNAWFAAHQKVYDAVRQSDRGNLLVPCDFFAFQHHFYLVTEKIETNGIQFDAIHRCNAEQKNILLKILAYQFSALAENGVVHSDVKPDNLLLKSTIGDYFTVKIIDFDASFLEKNIPDPDDIVGDIVYYAPETIQYIVTEEGTITSKADVFALGIVFHQILCGKLPQFDQEKNGSVAQALLNEEEIQINTQIAPAYQRLIRSMLELEPKKRFSAMQVYHVLCEIEASRKRNHAKKPHIEPPPLSGEPTLKNSVWKRPSELD